MYAITNKHGNNTALFPDLQKLYNEYYKIFNFYDLIIPSYDDILNNIKLNGYFEYILNQDTYYIIKTSVASDHALYNTLYNS
jgi:hypothetical protein